VTINRSPDFKIEVIEQIFQTSGNKPLSKAYNNGSCKGYVQKYHLDHWNNCFWVLLSTSLRVKVEEKGKSYDKLGCIVWRLEVNVWLKTNKKCLENNLAYSIGLEDVSCSSFSDEG